MSTSRHSSSQARLGLTVQLILRVVVYLLIALLDARKNGVKSLSRPLKILTTTTTSSIIMTRRDWCADAVLLTATTTLSTNSQPVVVRASADDDESSSPAIMSFKTIAFGRQEYTNSITASRDTNLSPAEAYDVIRQHIPPVDDDDDDDDSNASSSSSSPRRRALDLGAGAGLSTQVLYETLGYHHIDAVDWSSTAWDDSVTQQPDSVHFYELSDDDFFAAAAAAAAASQQQQQQQLPPLKYDVIVYNFAVNKSKAEAVAKRWLRPGSGLLLAPCNDKNDYWYKQSYLVLNAKGNVVWKSGQEVGAWSVQFQPDVTSPTCTGFWCGNENGYFAKRRQQRFQKH